MAKPDAALDTVFRALADPARRAVLRRLGQGPASVGELARPFQMALPSFLKYLWMLEASGLVASRKVGRVRHCKIRPAGIAAAEDWIAAERRVWTERTDRLARFVEDTQAREMCG